jgi:hypothetical protein
VNTAFGRTKVELEQLGRYRQALQIMKDLRVSSEGELIDLLFTSTGPVRRRQQVCKALGYIASAAGERALVEIFEKSPRLRKAAWKGLLSIQWKKSYFDVRKRSKEEARRLISELGVSSVEELISIVSDKLSSRERRITACIALGDVGLVKALRPLLKLFREDDAQLLSAASNAVIAIRSRAATPQLLTVVKRTTNIVSRECAIYALRSLSDPRAKRSLIRVIDNPNEAPSTRSLAVEALAATSNARDAIDALIRATHDDSISVRYAAVNAIETDNSRARKALRERLKDTGRLKGKDTIGKLAHHRLEEYKKFS